MRVGGKIRALRKSKENKMSSTELARRADISQSYVIEIESGKKNPSLDVLSRIAKALEVSLTEILSGGPQAPAPPRYRYIPVIADVSSADWLDTGEMDFLPGFGADYELTDSEDPSAFYIIAKGDSMVGGRIREGDYLLITPNSPCNSGDIVMARTKKAVMVGRFAKEENSVALESLEPGHRPIRVERKAAVTMYKVAEIKIKL